MGSTNDFFKEKKDWSKFKDRILDYYLAPYINKVLFTKKPLLIIDCFAGKGKFDDRDIGSPIIIAEHIKKIIDNPSSANTNIFSIFIEKKYSKELEENLNGYKKCNVVDGAFEDNIEKILALDSKYNIFMYVDPYGIKSLDFKKFDKVSNKKFSSLELLINFNSFGFIREGCRILGESLPANIENDGGEDVYEIDETNNVYNMDQIANGNYWQDILRNMKKGEINIRQAEERIIVEYVVQLRKLFKYVINIPIKKEANHIPKYRIIFGTNHLDGLVLMTDEMHKAWRKIQEEQRKGQFFLFECVFPDSSLSKGVNPEKDIVSAIQESNNSIKLKDLLPILIEKYGIYFSISEYNKILKKMNGNDIRIKWKPEYTRIKGRKVTSMDYKKYDITVELINGQA